MRRRWILVSLAVAAAALAWLHAGTTLVVTRSVSQPGAIVSLASHEWERLPVTARLAQKYPNSLILLTQPRNVTEYSCSGCAFRAARLVASGVAWQRIHLLPDPVSNTFEEAKATRVFTRAEGIQAVIIVTSPYHSRRALMTFQRVFAGTGVRLGVEPALTASAADPDHWWLHEYDRWYVAYEWTALLSYGLRHRLSLGAEW